MSALKDLHVRPIRQEDVPRLEKWRQEYSDGLLAWQHGLAGEGVETVCAEKNGKLIGSLTGVKAVIIDPFVHDPNAPAVDTFMAVYMMERVLSYQARLGGAITAYTSVGNNLQAYKSIVERSGYIEAFRDCTILRRPFPVK